MYQRLQHRGFNGDGRSTERPYISLYVLLGHNGRPPTQHDRVSLQGAVGRESSDLFHVDIFYFPRGRHSFPPKFHLIPPKNFFFPTWKRKILHLDISKSPRGNHFSPTQLCIDTCPTLNYCNDPTSSRRAPLPIKSKTSPCREARECQVGGRPLSDGNSIVVLTGTDALRLDTHRVSLQPLLIRWFSSLISNL